MPTICDRSIYTLRLIMPTYSDKRKIPKLKIFASIIAEVAIAFAAPYTISKSVFAQTSANSDVRINSIKLEETLVAEVMNGYLEVPDRNTNVSAYGGRMRLYDVHIARAIALSHHFYCNPPYIGGIEKLVQWEYRANNGRINMGTFNLRCTSVEQAIKTYGLGKSVPMEVQLTDRAKKIVNVRVLDIQGDVETNNFLNFVQTIRPQR
ncbi:hypothetical protein ACE1CD_13155 [Aerosakkonema sp. BLCC-F183]|uniref:hypothetical protein n=1 Tax=Aerosakkonema sp. BLCC-F183 TaxID=3342834 RepID=UPI0035B8B14E